MCVSLPTIANSVGNDTGTTTIQESQVVGLTSDLGARPMKGSTFATGRAAMVDRPDLSRPDPIRSGAPWDGIRVHFRGELGRHHHRAESE
jgi:hypothetical protein